ncbi:MAG: hypothetical protein MAG458_01215 [Nitrosopumilus sp.]|nr:hypothetical protein [Nitrosopumilus sp.]
MRFLFFSLFLILIGMNTVYAESVTSEISSEKKYHVVDEQIMIVADISNSQNTQQPFAYLTQVTNDDDVVVSLSWLTGSLSPKQSLSPAQSWMPTESGLFTIEIFVWESIDNPEALSPPLSMTVNVHQRQS